MDTDLREKLGNPRIYTRELVLLLGRARRGAGRAARTEERKQALARKWYRTALEAGLTEAQAVVTGMHFGVSFRRCGVGAAPSYKEKFMNAGFVYRFIWTEQTMHKSRPKMVY